MNYYLLKVLFLVVINTFTGLNYSQGPEDEPLMQVRVYKIIGLTKIKIYIYQGRDHGFFHYYRYPEKDNPDFLSTMEYTVKFLTSIGCINGERTIKK